MSPPAHEALCLAQERCMELEEAESHLERLLATLNDGRAMAAVGLAAGRNRLLHNILIFDIVVRTKAPSQLPAHVPLHPPCPSPRAERGRSTLWTGPGRLEPSEAVRREPRRLAGNVDSCGGRGGRRHGHESPLGCGPPPSQTCPISTEGGTRRVQFVRGGRGSGGGAVPPPQPSPHPLLPPPESGGSVPGPHVVNNPLPPLYPLFDIPYEISRCDQTQPN